MTGISGLYNNIGNCLGGIDLFVENLSILTTGRSGGKYFCNSKLSIIFIYYILFLKSKLILIYQNINMDNEKKDNEKKENLCILDKKNCNCEKITYPNKQKYIDFVGEKFNIHKSILHTLHLSTKEQLKSYINHYYNFNIYDLDFNKLHNYRQVQ